IRGKAVFYYTEKILGIDGIPESSQGKSIVIIKPNSSSMLAALLMKKRGVHVLPIFFDTGKENQEEYINIIKRDLNKNIVVVDISRFLNSYKEFESLCMLCQVYCEGLAGNLAEKESVKTIISPTCFSCDNTSMSIKALQYLEEQSKITVIRPIQMQYYGSTKIFELIDKQVCCPFKKHINYELFEDFDKSLVDEALSQNNQIKI
ncbi:MAG: hypothetical protein ACTSR2_09955, partial [Candidatus Hodarchaeales archaeon]